MAESFNVIALISGGKDSFFSLLHCIQNGHKIVALANLYPAPTPAPAIPTGDGSHPGAENEDEHDLNSFMYQTVGHTVIPLYAQALQIPLYRAPITGTAVQTSASYACEGEDSSGAQDETESLVPILKIILAEHPSANALSTGAILSTYQRTRVESVALRLGLTPLGFLWKYPVLPPGTQISLLEDMQSVGFDARIIKVASGGLDDSFLWENVANLSTMRRVEKGMKRFGTDSNGAVLGEGGEFETLVIDGPSNLFKGRINIMEEDRSIVQEGGGAAWLRIRHAEVVMKNLEEPREIYCRLPGTFDPRFSNILETLNGNQEAASSSGVLKSPKAPLSQSQQTPLKPVVDVNKDSILYWTVTPTTETASDASITQQTSRLVAKIQKRLTQLSLQSTEIISTMIVLRSMQDFAAVNKIYSTLFTKPNPPARVTISCGTDLPKNTHLIIHLRVHNFPSSNQPEMPSRKALHVQSRSYWAPANIGPYSQAISIPLFSPADTSDGHGGVRAVAVAGQIPLIPHTMTIPDLGTQNSPSSSPTTHEKFLEYYRSQTILSLQHLWRVGEEMDVGWWTSVVAYLPVASAAGNAELASIAAQTWKLIHQGISVEEDDDGEERDLWEERFYAGMAQRGPQPAQNLLPDWDVVKLHDQNLDHPPFFAVQVDELPKQSGIEWHAHVGVVKGPVTIHPTTHDNGWSIYQCAFGGRLQSTVVIKHLEHSSEASKALHRALEVLGLDGSKEYGWSASYLDVSIQDAWSTRISSGMVPCTKIWGDLGERLSAVLILDTVVE